jgi:hypothetical protein
MLFLDGNSLGIVGHEPVWRNNHTIVYHTDRPVRGTFQVDIVSGQVTKLSDKELVELAAGGDQWAGVEPGVGIHHSQLGLIQGAGQPAIAHNGESLWRINDSMVEPSICLKAAAWGNGRGRILGTGRDLTVAPPEYRPRVFDTPEGPWLLTMTHTTLRLRPFGATNGYTRNTGDNNNLHADAIWKDGSIHVVYQNSRGEGSKWVQAISAPREAFGGTSPQPNPTPTPTNPVPPQMSVPDCKHIVERVRSKYDTPLGSQHAAFLAELISVLLAETNIKFGLLRKSGGTHIVMPSGAKVSQDVIAAHMGKELWTYDVLGHGETKATPAWNRTKPTGIERDLGRFYAPTAADRPSLPPPTDGDGDGDSNQGGNQDAWVLAGQLLSGLKKRLAELEARILELEQKGPGKPVVLPKKVALKSDHGFYLVAEADGRVHAADRTAAGPWESWEFEAKE